MISKRLKAGSRCYLQSTLLVALILSSFEGPGLFTLAGTLFRCVGSSRNTLRNVFVLNQKVLVYAMQAECRVLYLLSAEALT